MAAEKKGGSGKKRKVKKTKQTAQKRAVAKAERKAKAAGKMATAEDIDAGEVLPAAHAGTGLSNRESGLHCCAICSMCCMGCEQTC